MGKRLYRVATCLYMQQAGVHSSSWIFRYQFRGRVHDLGLGPCDLVSTAEAKAVALEYRAMALKGINPREHHRSGRREAGAPTFEQCAAEHFKRALPALKNPKSRQNAENSLRAYVLPVIGSMRVDEIRPPHVARCLEKIWITHRETSRKLRSRIERIFDAARAAGYLTGDNPAALAILESLLPQRPRQAVAHHKALPWRELPAFVAKVVAKPTISAKALMWTILTAVRTSDTLGAQWDEIDEADALWTIPPERTKTGRPHRVPLSSAALAILESLPRESTFLFPGKPGKSLSHMPMLELARTIKPGLTVHGFRSTAKDWCSENGIVHEVSEAMLGHAVAKSRTVAAYLRTDQLDARRDVMERYAALCFGGEITGRRKKAKEGERDILDVLFGIRRLSQKWQRYVEAEKKDGE